MTDERMAAFDPPGMPPGTEYTIEVHTNLDLSPEQEARLAKLLEGLL
jgi:hypothetical protein